VRGLTIPRWTLDPVPGVGEHEVTIPDDVAAALRRLGVPLGTALLAAHAKVLAALTGEHEVATGYVAEESGRPLPCRLTTEPDSWRALLVDAGRVESTCCRSSTSRSKISAASWA
jgi:hypothetical protein